MNEEIRLALIRVLPFAIVLIILFLRIKLKKLDPAVIDIRKPLSVKRFLFWTLGFLLFSLLTEFILYKLDLLEIDKWNHPLFPSVIRIFGAVILAPIAEELLFRGLILNMLIKRKINKHLAIFIQASLFVLLHNVTYQNTFTSYFSIAQGLLDSTLYAYARYNTRSLFTPIAMHATGNFIATFERFIF